MRWHTLLSGGSRPHAGGCTHCTDVREVESRYREHTVARLASYNLDRFAALNFDHVAQCHMHKLHPKQRSQISNEENLNMKILVPVKRVVDANAHVRVKAD